MTDGSIQTVNLNHVKLGLALALLSILMNIGMVAQMTGGTPSVTGVFYDDSFDRTYFSPGSNCQGAPGAEVAFAEDIDVDSTRLDAGGTPGQPMTQIDPAKLPLAISGGKCVPVFPHDFVRVNNVFEIIKSHGGRTAWSDKHPAYEWMNGPSGKGLDDFYALEQDSLIPGTKVKTTGSFKAQRDFDEARVKTVINQMRGLDSTGASKQDVPQLFGMNFQAVSVGQKLPKAGPGDDASLIWLKPQDRDKNLAAATAYLEGQVKALGIGQILTANQMALAYQDPAKDSRTPDFIVTVNPGVVYTSGSKIAEHGGANANDRSVALLISSPALHARTVTALVQTTQVAPTMLQALGYDPAELQAVGLEGTQVLPGSPY